MMMIWFKANKQLRQILLTRNKAQNRRHPHQWMVAGDAMHNEHVIRRNYMSILVTRWHRPQYSNQSDLIHAAQTGFQRCSKSRSCPVKRVGFRKGGRIPSLSSRRYGERCYLPAESMQSRHF